MDNNTILARLGESLGLDAARMAAIFALGGQTLSEASVRALIAGDTQDGDSVCTDAKLTQFLDALIVERRGPRDPALPARPPEFELTNNSVLQKLRIALKLHESDMLDVFDAGGHPVSSRELGALFRKPGNRHYRTCADDLLDAFLRGLAARSGTGLEDG